jgi:hypothetical protein
MAGMVIVLGFALRLYAFLGTPVINPDGILYIQQAKAIHYGLWDQVLACYPYLASYPLLVALSYRVFEDWVVSAKLVSLVFGTATLIPLYLLLRRFWGVAVSVLALLIFAISPSFVEFSREVIRGPIFWFFAVLGLVFFVRHMETQSLAHLFLASISFLMGSWARTEGLIFILVVPLYLLFSGGEHRWRLVTAFVLPPLLVTLAVGALLWSFQLRLSDLFATKKIWALAGGPVTSYQELRESLQAMKDNPPQGIRPYFFDKVRNLVWLVALGALGVEIVRAFFLPFFLIFVAGLSGAAKRIRGDPRLGFLALMSVCALPLLYAQVLHSWAMFARFAAVFLFPAYVVVGFGVQRITGFLEHKLGLRLSAAYGLFVIAVLLVAVPKDLRSHDRLEKVVFKDIGEYIAKQKEDRKPVAVGAGFKEVRLIHFYAHVDGAAAPCLRTDILPKNKGRLLSDIRDSNVDYYVWDEKTGTQDQLARLRGGTAGAVTELKEWYSPKLGRLILFKVQS